MLAYTRYTLLFQGERAFGAKLGAFSHFKRARPELDLVNFYINGRRFASPTMGPCKLGLPVEYFIWIYLFNYGSL